MKTHGSGEQVREEPGDLAQEGALGLHASKLLEEGEGHDLGIREFFEGFVVSSFGVEPVVSIVYSAEQNGEGLFQEGQVWGKLGLGHPMLLWSGSDRMASFLHCQTSQHTSSSTKPPLLTSVGPAVSTEEIRISVDHVLEKAIGDNWQKALDADNLHMEFQTPNSYREIIQMRHPELRE